MKPNFDVTSGHFHVWAKHFLLTFTVRKFANFKCGTRTEQICWHRTRTVKICWHWTRSRTWTASRLEHCLKVLIYSLANPGWNIRISFEHHLVSARRIFRNSFNVFLIGIDVGCFKTYFKLELFLKVFTRWNQILM